MDWIAIKNEYVTTSISYRKLAEKYGIPFSTLKCQAMKDKWFQQREQYRHKVETKSIAKAEAKAVDYKSTLYALAFKVAKQLSDMTDNNSVESLAAMGIKPRDITGAIKDLEDALHVKSESDLREQEARIAKLRKEAEDESKEDKTIQVVISGGAEDYSE